MPQTNISLEDVIEGVDRHLSDKRDGPCFGCPYYEYRDCEKKLGADAITLLKADLQAIQEAQAALETEAYMEQWEPTYTSEDGSL